MNESYILGKFRVSSSRCQRKLIALCPSIFGVPVLVARLENEVEMLITEVSIVNKDLPIYSGLFEHEVPVDTPLLF